MIKKQVRITWAELNLICAMRNILSDGFREDVQRTTFLLRLTDDEAGTVKAFRAGDICKVGKLEFCQNEAQGLSLYDGKSWNVVAEKVNPNRVPRGVKEKNTPLLPSPTHAKGDKSAEEYIRDLEAALELRKASKAEVYEIKPIERDGCGQSQSVAIVLLSDAHVEEVVELESVLGCNEYNPAIAKARMDAFFVNSAKIISHDQRSYTINHVVLGCLGDMIGNWIHDELMQTNAMSPLEAITFAKSMLLSGMKYWQDNLKVDKITFVGVVGNHGRTTKKSQFANATDVSMEYFMYKDIEEMAKILGLTKFEFVIPKAEMAVVKIFDKRFLFYHGTSVKFMGGIGGLVVPLMRWFLRLSAVLKIDMAFVGHFHQSIYTKKFTCNGSLKGYDSYAIGKGLDFEPPQQTKLILNEKRGITSYTPIFLD